MSERTTERMVVLLLLMLVIWFFGEYLAAIRYGLFALLLVPIVVYLGSSRWRRMSDEARRLSAALLVTAVLLTLGIGILWVTRKELNLQGDTAFLALLLVPLVVYLALTDKLKEINVFGASASFIEKNVVDELARNEPEKSKYFGKLKQVLEKDYEQDKKSVCLIYADVDDLRPIARKIYGTDKQNAENNPGTKRKTEREIGEDIINQLVSALADAFCEAKVDEKAKYDVFLLGEPDVIMITRSVPFEKAKQIAKAGREKFAATAEYNATLSVLEVSRMESPRELHKRAAGRLSDGKDLGKGSVYYSK